MPKKRNSISPGAVLVTGGAKRIGAQIAVHLASRGYSIALHYNHSRKEADELARRIRDALGECEIFGADLNSPRGTLKLLATVIKKFSNLNALINNASIFERSRLKDLDFKNLDRHFAVNLRAPLILMSQFAKLRSSGVIVNILDTNVAQNKTSYFNYLFTKKSLADLTKMAAVELAPQIRVNAIAPGLILPPERKSDDSLDRLAKNIPLKRRGAPEGIARAVQFLIENDYITGQTIFVDGGEHLT